MKKITLLAALLFGFFAAQAQSDTGLEIGLKVSPAIVNNRVIAPNEFGIEKEGSKLRFGIGLVFDYFFGEHYAFSTGLEYSSKGASVKYNNREATGNQILTDEINVQYLQLPVGVKLYTNEVATYTRVYFHLATSVNARISSKVNDDNFYKKADGTNVRTNNRFKFFEADAIVGTGVESQLGTNTKVFGGVSYRRGLTNIDSYYEDYYKNRPNSQDISLKNNVIALDLGLKF